WNIAGAGPVYRETVIYTADNGNPPPESKPELFCGRQVISLGGVDDVFRDPPDTVQLSSSHSRETRTHVGLVPPEEPGSTPVCIGKEEYRARALAQPGSATAQYLYARLKTGREGSAAIEQLAQRYPQEPLILRSAIYNRWRSGDWHGTLQAWESLRSLSPQK